MTRKKTDSEYFGLRQWVTAQGREYVVSTVKLPPRTVDPAPYRGGPYETAVFGTSPQRKVYWHGLYYRHYDSETLARAGHLTVIAELMAGTLALRSLMPSEGVDA